MMIDFFHSDQTKKSVRVVFLLFMDVVLLNLASFLALYVRYEFQFGTLLKDGFLNGWVPYTLIYTAVAIAIFFPMKFYSSLWRFAGIQELMHIVFAVSIIGVLHILMLVLELRPMPRSYPVLNGVFLLGFLSFSRFSYRALRSELRSHNKSGSSKRTMLIGAGSAGAMALREFQSSDKSDNHVVCFIDDDPAKKGAFIRNVKIMGNRDDIVPLAESLKIEEIVFAIPAATSKNRREIFEICKQTKASMKIIPGIFQLANGDVTLQKIRSVNVLDLLGRDSVKVDLTEIASYLTDKVVLVTGGGGSIGSELCRQIATYDPKKLIIFDIYENNAYGIQQELFRNHAELNLTVQIGSVQDTERIRNLFETHHPEIVFHAAAHKHVPLMEESPNEAIKNNVFGTRNVAMAADAHGVHTFVMISTDKAVNPTNVMGASKRICEMIIQGMANKSKTRFVAVRFGNVLGSNGSVIPLFKEQIEAGGPVTVTHKDIIRYFMTIPESVSLVLQAGAYAQKGEIFVLDMGDPVRIDDLARNMIRLSGFEPDVDIEVKYTGLRPGEKLYEEMLMQEEGMRNTANELIFIGKALEMDVEKFEEQLEELRAACESNSVQIKQLVEGIVPTYKMTREIAVVGN